MFQKLWTGLASIALVISVSAAGAADLVPTPIEPATVTQVEPDLPATQRFFVHLGPAYIEMDEGAKIEAGGAEVEDATISIDSDVTAGFEIGYFFTPEFAVSIAGGLPPTAQIDAAGSLDALGEVGEAVYGPVSLTAHYHFRGLGWFQPYIGAGPVFNIVFSEDDTAMSDLDIESSFGFAVQAGADMMLTDRWGLFIDAKKAILRTDATGYLGPAPVDAEITLDPLVISGGLTVRF